MQTLALCDIVSFRFALSTVNSSQRALTATVATLHYTNSHVPTLKKAWKFRFAPVFCCVNTSQRAQIIVEANEWLQLGNVKAQITDGSNDPSKTTKELSKKGWLN